MNTLVAEYPNGAELEFEIPSAWHELTRKQFAAIAPYVYGAEVRSLLTRFAYIILGKKLFTQISSLENMDELVHAFQFLLTPPLLQKSHYKGFRLFGVRWFGIDNNLLDMTIKDFGLLEQTLANFEHKLNQQIFFETVYKCGILKYIPLREKKKAALRLNYQAVRASISAMYPKLKSKEGGSPDYHGLIIAISAGPFGTKNQTEKALLHDVLKYMEQEAIRAEKEKYEAEKLSKQ